jgi:hypothetical protein
MCYVAYEKKWTNSSISQEMALFMKGYRFILKDDYGKIGLVKTAPPVYKEILPPAFILQYREALKPKRPMRIEDVPIEISNKYLLTLHHFADLYVIWKSWGTDASGLQMEFGPEFYAAFKEQIQAIEKALQAK